MSGLDSLLASSTMQVIEQELGEKTKQIIQERLFYKYGIGFAQAMKNFDKLDLVLREFFGSGADGFERKILNKICDVQMSQTAKSNLVTIHDQSMAKTVLAALGDKDKKAILESTMTQPLNVAEILKATKISIMSCRQKINLLIESGLLYEVKNSTSDNKADIKYKALFDNINLKVIKNNVTVGLQINNESLMHSSVVRTVYAM